MSQVRIGVLGVGRGAGLAKAARYAPSAAIAALCDPNEERLAQASAATNITATYTRYEDLLDTDVDAILVASPMPLHVQHTVEALRAGKHVLSEVTAATSLDQCWELLEAVRKSDHKYMFAENYCYVRPWTLVKEMVHAGLFGEIYYGESDQIQEFKGGFPLSSEVSNWRTSELAMRKGHHYITHDLGPLYQVFGERITSVTCLGSGQHHLPWVKADDTCVVLCQTESGKLIRIRLDFFSNRPNNYTHVGLQGTQACYEAPYASEDDFRIYVEGKTPRGSWQSLWDYSEYLPDRWKEIPVEALNDGYDGGSPLMIEDFARCIIDDTRPPIDVVDALNMTAPGLVSEISREKGGVPVDVPKFEYQ